MHDNKSSPHRSLEEEFFARQNQELMQKLRAENTRAETKIQLAAYSGIKDDSVLESLLDQDIQPSTLAALSYVPLVLTAWADGVIEPKEREAILKALNEQGIDADHPAYSLLEGWLKDIPDSKLFETWKTYVKGLSQSMDQSSFESLRKHIMQRTQRVAESAGGILGMGSKISVSEREQMARLENAFQVS